MSQSLVKNLVHLVYSTKHRQLWIPAEHRDGLFAYQASIFKQWESPESRSTPPQDDLQDELRALFKKHKMEFDERYLWD